MKNNIGDKAPGIGYHIEKTVISNDIEAPYLRWSDEPVDVTADQALAASISASRDGGALYEVKQFLREMFSDGAVVDAKEAEEAAEAHGISERTLRRARKELKIVPEKDGYQGTWKWRLPR